MLSPEKYPSPHSKTVTTANPTQHTRRRAVTMVLIFCFSLAALATLTACAPKPTVLVFGDSLITEAESDIRYQLGDAYDVRVVAFGGTALCDFSSRIVEDARALRPQMVVLSFSGNALTPCMRPPAGTANNVAWWAAKYELDLNNTLSRLAALGVPTTVVGAPPSLARAPASNLAGSDALLTDAPVGVGVDMPIAGSTNPSNPGEDLKATSLSIGQVPSGYVLAESFVNAIYQRIVISQRTRGVDVGFVDGGRFLRSPSGGWTRTLGCLPWETAAMGCVGGVITVRSPDFVHFCPTATGNNAGVISGCSSYSSGAWRYATAIAGYVENRMTPTVGSLDAVTAPASQQISVAGWALDPDTDQSPISVHVYTDGTFTGTAVANAFRSDVAAVYPWSGPLHGFNATFSVTPGVRQVCVYAISVGSAPTNPLLGCRTVTVLPSAPLGSLDSARPTPNGVQVAGWTADFDAPTTPLTVHIYVGDRFAASVVANQRRADIGNAFPAFGPNRGFNTVLPVAPGTHRVCAYALNVGAGTTNPAIGCRTVTVPAG